MSEPLVFMMGEFEAQFPTDRKYATNHMWATELEGAPDEEPTCRFGFTAYAVRLLQDVYFLDWLVQAPATLDRKQEIGSIESKKAESALYAPVEGELTRFNKQLMEDPSAINVDKYSRGWLFEIRAAGETLLSAEEYVKALEGIWDMTQKTIKGQLNQ